MHLLMHYIDVALTLFFFTVFMRCHYFFFFFFNDTATTEIYTLSLHDALPISHDRGRALLHRHSHPDPGHQGSTQGRSEEHTSELQSRPHLVCRLLLEKKKKKKTLGVHATSIVKLMYQ